MDVYILLSNEFSFLDIQIELIKKYIINLNKIYLVVGPFADAVHMKSHKFIEVNGTSTIVLPLEKKLMLPKLFRMKNIYDYIIQTYVKDNVSLIMHSDIFPIQKFEMPQEYNIIGRGHKNKLNLSMTWVCVRPGYRIVNYTADKTYSCFCPTDTNFQRLFNQEKNGIRVEWCEPSFIHTDDITIDTEKNIDNRDKKLEFLKKYSKEKLSVEYSDKEILPQDVMSLTKRYISERKKWKDAGSPLRTQEQMNRIFSICQPCPFFSPSGKTTGQCLICGCNLKKNGTTLNKIAWATTECPKNPPEWIAETEFVKYSTPVEKKVTEKTKKKCCGEK